MRWLWLVVAGVACLAAAVVLGVLSVSEAVDVSAYHGARACLAGAAPNADCLQTVDGAVTGVTEFPGGGRVSADYALDVQTSSTTLHLTFRSPSAMLDYAVDGNPAVVTMWHGAPVSVLTDGRSSVTTAVPETAFAGYFGGTEQCGGFGVAILLAGLARRRSRRADGRRSPGHPMRAAGQLALVLGAVVVAIGGLALRGTPSRFGPDLAATGAALAVVLGLSAWLGIRGRKAYPAEAERDLSRVGLDAATLPASFSPVRPAPAIEHTADVPAPVQPAAALERTADMPATFRPRLDRAPVRLAILVRRLRPVAAGWLIAIPMAAVLFGVFLAAQDGPPARDFRGAPACAGETNLATCVGDFTAVINGVRSPANGANFADVSYVTQDAAINAWGRFDGNAAAIARSADSEMNARTPLRIRAWRRSIIGAELGGRWQWTQGNPPGNTLPSIFLGVSFALLLVVARGRIHRRAGWSRARVRKRLLIEDVGQATAAAGSVVLLAYGFWPGAILALAALIWLAFSARRRPLLARQLTARLG
ncbi:MAG TPA: hypothetical protein VGI58_13615 [Streptosporangiaceae bacterium]